MLLFIREDEHGFIYEPHGTESECWSTTPEGSAVLKEAGWRPYEMQRVSRYVHECLLIDGLLKPLNLTPRSFVVKPDLCLR